MNKMMILGLLTLIGLSNVFAQTLTDIDGNVYDTVTIGTQVWMKENLKTTKYRDGSSIYYGYISNATWNSLTIGAYCNYSNSDTFANIYGKLYNYYTVIDSRKICPTGWHVPTNAEWTQLIDYLGGPSVAGGKMKETGTAHWASTNVNVDNSSGFTALPGGHRGDFGVFNCDRINGYWWSSTFHEYKELTTDVNGITSNTGSYRYGLSIRCLQDLATDINNMNNIEQIKLFPNPATKILTIETNSNATIEIINIQGQIVKTLNTSTANTTIDIINLTKGVYSIRIKTEKETIVNKMIKQ